MLRRTFTLLLVTGLTIWPAQKGMGAPPPTPCGVDAEASETLCGDSGPAPDAFMLRPEGVAVAARGGFLVADTGNDAIRRVARDGTITTVAGFGVPGFGGDGGPAIVSQLNLPADVAGQPDGGYLIADTGNGRVRRVSARGTITTVAGGGQAAPSTTPAPARRVRLSQPTGVASTYGDVLIADAALNEVLRVSRDGKLRVVAGTSVAGASGDGGPATADRRRRPR